MVMSQEKKCDNGVQMLWAPNFPQQEPYKKKVLFIVLNLSKNIAFDKNSFLQISYECGSYVVQTF